jgi:ribonuclease T2
MIEDQKMEIHQNEFRKLRVLILNLFLLLLFAMTFTNGLYFVLTQRSLIIQLKENQNTFNDTDFDLLIFTQRWANSVCTLWMDKSKSNTCHLPEDRDSWTVHGISPFKLQTKGPEYCDSNQPFDLEKLNPIKDELMQKWTNIERNKPYKELWRHEWMKHGTCAAQHIPAIDTELKYFQKGLDFLDTYSVTKLLNATDVQPGLYASYRVEKVHAVLKLSLNKSFAIICETDESSKQIFLKEIRICFDKNFNLQNCNGILTDDEDPEDEIITNCKKGQFIMYPSDFFVWRQEFDRKVDEKFSFGDWLDNLISAV